MLINVLKNHLIDVVCRISPFQKEKTHNYLYSVEMMGDDGQPNLAAYSLKGVQLNGEDVYFGQYLA